MLCIHIRWTLATSSGSAFSLRKPAKFALTILCRQTMVRATAGFFPLASAELSIASVPNALYCLWLLPTLYMCYHVLEGHNHGLYCFPAPPLSLLLAYVGLWDLSLSLMKASQSWNLAVSSAGHVIWYYMIIQNWKWNCPFSIFWSYMVKHYYVQRWSNSKYLFFLVM